MPHQDYRDSLLWLNNYNTTLNWIPGKEMIFSDHLSRNIRLGDEKPKELTCECLDLKVEDLYLNASEDKCVSLAKETEKD